MDFQLVGTFLTDMFVYKVTNIAIWDTADYQNTYIPASFKNTNKNLEISNKSD